MLIAANKLIFDQALYPRSKPSSQNIAGMVEAMRAGWTPPAIVVDKKTKRIVDGVHRWRAWIQEHGEESEIECELVSRDTEGELFALSVELNAQHGLQLAAFERTDCLI